MQKGNILFLILLAVVLFAALAYAVTSSMRGGGKDAAAERHDLFASSLIGTASLLEQNMMRAMLVDDVKEYGFDLSGTNSRAAGNATCANPRCRMIAGNSQPLSEGGSVAIPATPLWAADTSVTEIERRMRPMIVSVQDVGTEASDVIWISAFLSRATCEALNRLLNARIDLAVADQIGGTEALRNYTGVMTTIEDSGGVIGDVANNARGHRSFCFYNVSWQYIFVHVLIAR